MTPFGIAGIQMTLGHGNNVDALEQRLEVVMKLYPWVQMVLFSELAAHGPLQQYAEPMPGPTEQRFQAMARKHSIWLIPGSAFEEEKRQSLQQRRSDQPRWRYHCPPPQAIPFSSL